eukprot:258178-Pelagomonas_calceolata.AAC.4
MFSMLREYKGACGRHEQHDISSEAINWLMLCGSNQRDGEGVWGGPPPPLPGCSWNTPKEPSVHHQSPGLRLLICIHETDMRKHSEASALNTTLRGMAYHPLPERPSSIVVH